MIRSSTKKDGRKYSSYVCGRVLKHGAAACPGSRAPAGELEAFVVERVRAVGRDPSVLRATLTADRKAGEARRAELDADLQRLRQERGRLDAERRNVEDAIAAGAAGMVERLRAVEAQLAEVDQQVADARRDIAALDAGSLDPGELERALAEFEPVWAELATPEKARVLALLLDRVTFDAESGEVEIKFRPGGPRLTTCPPAGTSPANGQANH
jgi:site-specific DNA recombinase